MKKYLKLIKSEESYNTWKDSDEAGYPHVAMYETNHPEITSGEIIIFEKSTEKPKLIQFTYGGKQYQAEEGMTWDEWIDSEYNESIEEYGYVYKGFIKLNDGYAGHYSYSTGGQGYLLLNNVKVLLTDNIVNEQTYTFRAIK